MSKKNDEKQRRTVVDLKEFKRMKMHNGIILTIFSLVYVIITTLIATVIINTMDVEKNVNGDNMEFKSDMMKIEEMVEFVDRYDETVDDVIYITTDYLNRRNEPNGEVIEVMEPYTVIDIISEENGWCKLSDGSFVYGEYVSKIIY